MPGPFAPSSNWTTGPGCLLSFRGLAVLPEGSLIARKSVCGNAVVTGTRDRLSVAVSEQRPLPAGDPGSRVTGLGRHRTSHRPLRDRDNRAQGRQADADRLGQAPRRTASTV